MKSILLLPLLLLVQQLSGQFSTQMGIFHSQNVRDSFEIYISTPLAFNRDSVYNLVYYCDANLKSGRHLQELLQSDGYAGKLGHTIFVGIGHIGNYHVLRRRDFILPNINGDDTLARDKNYGH
ncbi:MAG TPA: hypothetical protein VGI82_07830, partial [Chitinophagaceae bacterium]